MTKINVSLLVTGVPDNGNYDALILIEKKKRG
jgi:hypothetical protein